TLLNSAKGPLMINGQPPVAPPDIPVDRLNLPPIPVMEPQMPDTSSQYTTSQTDQSQQTQHMPGQQATASTSQTPPTSTVAPPTSDNTFLNGPPPPPGAAGWATAARRCRAPSGSGCAPWPGSCAA